MVLFRTLISHLQVVGTMDVPSKMYVDLKQPSDWTVEHTLWLISAFSLSLWSDLRRSEIKLIIISLFCVLCLSHTRTHIHTHTLYAPSHTCDHYQTYCCTYMHYIFFYTVLLARISLFFNCHCMFLTDGVFCNYVHRCSTIVTVLFYGSFFVCVCIYMYSACQK